MKIQFDPEKCAGHAQCNAVAPEIYVLDDNGYCIVGDVEVPQHLEQAALRGARVCPERAITTID